MKNLQQNSSHAQDSGRQSTPQSYPTQPITWQPQPYDTSVGPHRRPRKFKSVGFGLLSFTLLLVVFGIVLYLELFKAPTANYTKAINQVAASIQTNGKLTADDLQAIDGVNLFLAGMYTVARQPVQHLTSERLTLESPTSKPVYPGHLFDSGYDYSSRSLNLTHQMVVAANDKSLSFDRCVDGKQYGYFDMQLRSNVTWEEEGKTDDYCNPAKVTTRLGINDGLNTGGMTAEQANTFVQSIFSQSGLVRVGEVGLAMHDGKEYIKIKAAIRPVKSVIDGKTAWHGTQALMWAFKDTGLDPLKHPYLTQGADSAGLAITQYIDPTTMLPAYAEYLKDTGLDENGKQVMSKSLLNAYDLDRVTYDFGGVVPRGAVDAPPEPIIISWPAEKR